MTVDYGDTSCLAPTVKNNMKKIIITKRNLIKGKLTPVALALIALSTFIVVSCDKQKADIDAKKESTISAIDNEKDAVNAAAENATKRTDINATIDKANIEAEEDCNPGPARCKQGKGGC